MHAPLPPRAPRRANALFVFVIVIVALSLAGCARDRASNSAALERGSVATQLLGPIPNHDMPPWPDPQRHRAHLPYPLAVGNRWDYRIRTITNVTTTTGVGSPDISEYPWQVLITGTTELDGRRYFLQSESDPSVTPPDPVTPYYERQDRTGLYEHDPPVALTAGAVGGGVAHSALAAKLVASVERMPAAAAHPEAFRRAAAELAQRVDAMLDRGRITTSAARARVPPAGEIAWLRYPLYVGASWIVRDSPRFSRRVAARERLVVPAGASTAWRLVGLSELYGPNDRVNFWYGEDGLLRFQYHIEANAVDNSGNIVGTVSTDSDQVLTNVELHDPSPIHYSAEEVADD